MDYRETLSALLPPPRDDEPASLRQDIGDELGDHLACAYNRELLRGEDSSGARQRVWERFGDPAAVARRLWLDAMKGKIMTQRVLIATCLVVMLACGATVALAWHWMNHDQLLRSRAAAEAIEANRRMSEALAQSQAANQEMLKQMRDMSLAVLHPVSPEWNPVIFKLTEESADGPPAAGFSLELTRLGGSAVGMAPGNTNGVRDGSAALLLANNTPRQLRFVLPPGIIAQGATSQLGGMGGMGGGMGGMGGGMGGMGGGMGGMGKTSYRTSDASGIGDFGSVPPGDYTFRVTKNWPEGNFSTTGQINVGPGTKVRKSLVCPKTPPQRVTVRVQCAWPDDLARKQLVLYAPFAFRYRKLEPGVEWSLADTSFRQRPPRRSIRRGMMNQAQGQPAIRSVLCGPGTTVTEILKLKGLFLWTFGQSDEGQPAEKAVRQRAGGRGWVGQGGGMGGRMETMRLGPGQWADLLTEDLRAVTSPSQTPEPHELEWETGTYGLDKLIVLRPAQPQPVEPEIRRFDVLVGCFVNDFGPSIQLRGLNPGDGVAVGDGFEVRGGAPTKKDLETLASGFLAGPRGMGRQGADDGLRWSAPTLELPTEYWDQVDLGFDARLGQVNEWTVPLPDELIKAVREALKVDPTAKAKPAGASPPADDN